MAEQNGQTQLAKQPDWMPKDLKKEPAIIQLLYQMRPQIAMALPRHVTPERMMRMTLTTLRKTPKLLQCDQRSVLQSIIELSQLGLEPGTPLGHAWIIPYGSEAQIIIGYKGMVNLADRGGIIMMPNVVYEGDVFDYQLGTNPHITHKPCEEAKDRGALRYAYVVAKFKDGRETFKVLTPAEIDRAKDASQAWRAGQKNKAKRDSPWWTEPWAMWMKTAIRRISPFLPLQAEYARAMELDANQEKGETQILDTFGIDWGADPAAAAQSIESRVGAAKRALDAKPAEPAAAPQVPADQANASPPAPQPPQQDTTAAPDPLGDPIPMPTSGQLQTPAAQPDPAPKGPSPRLRPPPKR